MTDWVIFRMLEVLDRYRASEESNRRKHWQSARSHLRLVFPQATEEELAKLIDSETGLDSKPISQVSGSGCNECQRKAELLSERAGQISRCSVGRQGGFMAPTGLERKWRGAFNDR